MIIYYIILIILSVVHAITSPLVLLPDVALDSNITSSISSIGNTLWVVSNLIPLTLATLFACLLIILGIETHIFSYKTIKWLYNKIPGVN